MNKVMRNTTNIYCKQQILRVGAYEFGKSTIGTSTVLDLRPVLIPVEKYLPSHLFNALKFAISCILRNEDKFVILLSGINDFHEYLDFFPLVLAVISKVKRNPFPVFYQRNDGLTEGEYEKFISSRTGCLMVKDYLFAGMETKSMIYLGDFSRPSKTKEMQTRHFLRCTTNLVVISEPRFFEVYRFVFRVLIPYPPGSEERNRLMNHVTREKRELVTSKNVYQYIQGGPHLCTFLTPTEYL